jgi:tetratricopeptide (TPR) repeat protein
MPLSRSCARATLALIALSSALLPTLLSCQGPREEPLLPRSQTWAELRTVRRSVTVAPPGEAERAPYPRERIVDGEVIKVDREGLAWLRRDGGATLLVHGPASLTVRAGAIDLQEGRVFVDTPIGVTAELTTPSGPLHLAQVRASIDVHAGGATEAYVLAGEVRTDGEGRALAGERLVITGKPGEGKATTSPALTWDDWTGGLATTDRAAEPSPYGVGTVGARRPGDQGSPRFSLSIQKLDVKVKIEQDFAITEVDEVFFNPSSDVVEGVYRFRTPDGATLHRFGVDRDGVIVWGRVKEKKAAAAQYQANVYQGSTEDPALLEWDAPGVYRARLYPIGPGESRRVVVRYAEWLGRNGPKGERRLYVYPMAAEGAEASLPHIEELYATIDLGRASAKEIRVGMAGVRDGNTLVVREHDFVPRADLAVELFDDSPRSPRGYMAPHVVDIETLPSTERAEALRQAKSEADYLLVPIRPSAAPAATGGGLDLAVVVDTSAATEASSLAIARAATAALLAHLGKEDRAVVWAGDTSLRAVVPGRDALKPIDAAGRQEIMTRLAGIRRGGATDLGAMLSQAAAALDPSRRSAIVYIGDGSPTVGELALADLQARLAKLPRPARIFALGVGDGADMAILKGLSRGAFAERIGDANAAARAALRLLETAERPVWLGASIDLGPNVERIFPRDLGALAADSSLVVLGRLTGEGRPSSVTITTANGPEKLPLEVTPIDDQGDLRRRWAEGRLAQMLDENTGRAAMVDLGSRHGIITPVTSLYVPTKNEMTAEERSELERARIAHLSDKSRSPARSSRGYRDTDDEREKEEKKKSSDFWRNGKSGRADVSTVAAAAADNKEGGTGTRAKGEEGSMGNPNSKITGNRYGVAGPAAAPKPEVARADALRDAAEFGMIGLATATAPAGAASAAPSPTSIALEPPKMPAPEKPAFAEREIEAAPIAAVPPEPKQAQLEARVSVGGKDAAKKPDLDTNSADLPAMIPASPAEQPMDGEDGRAQAFAGELMDRGAVGHMWGAVDERGGSASALTGKAELSKGGEGDLLNNTGEGFGSGHGRLGGRHRESTIDAITETVTDGKLKEKQSESKNELAQRSGPVGGVFATRGVPFSTSIAVRVGDVPHFALRCGNAAFVPFEERIQLWRERLAPAVGNPVAAANVYRRALHACEAPTFRERGKLLSLLLDAMPAVRSRVALWRVLFRDLGAADTLYRGILARVRTPAEARELHDALGLKSIDPGVLAKLLKDAKTPADRVNRLRALVAEWPDDFVLSLRLLDALEDTSDDAGARSFGNQLRARPDADARLRTAVGELYLRLAARASTPDQKALDEGEARRAFGEIVEYAPDDPVARRRLGDLLRAHGLFADAARQYETLARLAPDDGSVPLLLAAAAEGLGKLEEAVKWTEKGGAAGSPDAEQSPARTARAFAATYLAWGRKAALDAGRADEAKALATRLARVLSTERTSSEALRGTRVALTWAHPEFHPTLWSNALGALMPAPEGDVTLGIAQAIMPDREGAMIEVRLEPEELEHIARLGATASLTAVFDEGGAGEKIVKIPLKFNREPTLRFSLAGGSVREVRP